MYYYIRFRLGMDIFIFSLYSFIPVELLNKGKILMRKSRFRFEHHVVSLVPHHYRCNDQSVNYPSNPWIVQSCAIQAVSFFDVSVTIPGSWLCCQNLNFFSCSCRLMESPQNNRFRKSSTCHDKKSEKVWQSFAVPVF